MATHSAGRESSFAQFHGGVQGWAFPRVSSVISNNDWAQYRCIGPNAPYT